MSFSNNAKQVGIVISGLVVGIVLALQIQRIRSLGFSQVGLVHSPGKSTSSSIESAISFHGSNHADTTPTIKSVDEPLSPPVRNATSKEEALFDALADEVIATRLQFMQQQTKTSKHVEVTHKQMNTEKAAKVDGIENDKSMPTQQESREAQDSLTKSGKSADIGAISLNEQCPYAFKVYIYDLPSEIASVRIAREARANKTLHICQKCILEQFSLEYVVHDFFHNFCGRTDDPSEADYFYLPIIRDAEFRVALDHNNKGVKDRRAPSMTEQALLEAMEKDNMDKWKAHFKVTDKYWKAHKGADHIIVMPAPVTNLRHQSSMRGFFHYMPHLRTPIFLNVEYSLSFVREYPVCSSQKNIVMPYPTTDPQLFNGKLHSDPVERHSLLYYAGGMHGDCVGVRRALKQIMINGTKISKEHIVPKYGSNMREREHGFRAATFCPIPIGDSPSSKRMYDVMHFGCIPVILSDDLVYAYSKESGGELDETLFSIRVPQSVVQFPTDYLLKKFGSPKAQALFGKLPDGTELFSLLKKADTLPKYEDGIYINPLIHILRMVSSKNLEILKNGVANSAPFYRYYQYDKNMNVIPTAESSLPNGGAMVHLANLLTKRKVEGIDKIREACIAEHTAKHPYRGNYPCDKDDGNSLYGRRARRLSTTDVDMEREVVLDETERVDEWFEVLEDSFIL
eukprot:GSChrysophyteH1.ASY1.ANO1.1181.1 assembled CDS